MKSVLVYFTCRFHVDI